MKTLITSLLLGAVIFPVVAEEEITVVAKDTSLASQLCMHAANDDYPKLKQTLTAMNARDFANTTRIVANNYQCNELPIAHFAHYAGAKTTLLLLNRHAYGDNKATEDTLEQPTNANNVAVENVVYVLGENRK